MAGLSEVFTQDLDVMAADQNAGEPEEKLVPYGKYKGKKWPEVPDQYLAWAVNEPKAPSAIKSGCELEMRRRIAVAQESVAETETDAEIPF